MRAVAVLVFVLAAAGLVSVLALAGCGSGGSSKKTPVAGTIVEKHVESKTATYIKVGGVLVPVGGGTRYVLVVDGPDGGAVNVSVRVWADEHVGDRWPPE